MNADFSLIDSNIERAKEGMRLIDEIARFILKDEPLFVRLKNLRHNLIMVESYFGPAHLIGSRAGEDVGGSINTKSEAKHFSSWALVRSNVGRVTESLRALEEYAKVYAGQAVVSLKNIRYALYQLERDILFLTPQYHLRSHFEAGIIYPLAESVEEVLWLVERGAKVVQLRDKSNNKEEIFSKTKFVCQKIAEFNKSKTIKTIFILNDHPDIAAELPVDGVHIGQEDGSLLDTRRLVGSNKIIGRSTHSLEQARRAVEDGADYISIGPVFATPTKAGRPAVGLDSVRQVATEIAIPWLAIGGIDEAKIIEVKQAGAKNFAVVRAAKNFFE